MGITLETKQRLEMDKAIQGLVSKADKIRALGGAGYKRADIARYLGIRYQHVRNVLLKEARPAQPETSDHADGDTATLAPMWTQIGPDGRLLIPAAFRRKLGIDAGDSVQMRIVDGELRLIGRIQALRRAQALVAKYVPAGTSLVDELIAERRREVADEENQ